MSGLSAIVYRHPFYLHNHLIMFHMQSPLQLSNVINMRFPKEKKTFVSRKFFLETNKDMSLPVDIVAAARLTAK
jgi:hypothetical protein